MSITAIGVFLRRIPFMASALDWIGRKRRLFVEYLLLAMFIAFAGLSVALWLTRKEVKQELIDARTELSTVRGRLTTVEFANQTQAQTIENLVQLRKADEAAMGTLTTDIKRITDSNASVRQKISELERVNEEVRNLRGRPVPSQLGCLLEPRSCQD